VAWLGSGILCVEDQALAVWNGFPRQFMRDAATQTHRDHGKWLRACTLYVYCLCFIFVFIAVMKFFHLFLQGFDSVGSREGEKSLTGSFFGRPMGTQLNLRVISGKMYRPVK